jgi:hypothetical protein
MENGESFGEDGLDATYDKILVQIIKIRYQISKISPLAASYTHSSPDMDSLADCLVTKCQDIKDSVESWSRSFPSTWHRQCHTVNASDPCLPDGLLSPTAYSYSSFVAGALWLRCYCLTMVVTDTHLRVLDLLPESSGFSLDKQRATCVYDLEAASIALASTMPFVLGRLIVPNGTPGQRKITIQPRNRSTPYVIRLVTGPLLLALRLRYISPELKVWFITELKSLLSIVGVTSLNIDRLIAGFVCEWNSWDDTI